MQRGVLVVIALLISSLSFAQKEFENTWLWQISGGELQGKSYIFGTVPAKDSTFFQFPDRVFKTLNASDVFLYFDESEVNSSNYSNVYGNTFGNLRQDFGVTPVEYLKGIATQGLKPSIQLDEATSMFTLYKSGTTNNKVNASSSQFTQLKEAYITANHETFEKTRASLDVPQEVSQQISKRLNYQIINELIDQMRLQPSFIAVDGIYLTGEEGLVSLLRARGYKLKALDEKLYVRKANEIEQFKQARAAYEAATNPPQQPVNNTNTPGTVIDQNPVNVPTQPTQYVKLDLPIGVLNLNQWSDYELKDGEYQYSAPQRLKNKNENRLFETNHGGLTYQIAIAEKWENTNGVIEQLMIQNGGQMVSKKRYHNDAVSGEMVELMYTENQISKHLLLPGVQNNLIVMVKGATPEIHSIVADQFLNSIHLDQIPEEIKVVTPENNNPVVQAPQWGFANLEGMNFSFPIDNEQKETTTDKGTTVKAIVSSKKVDKNTFVVVASKKDAFDNFQLFNTAINKATDEVRGVIVERKVLPVDRSNFAEYLVKDAIDNFYRIQYYYQNNTFYQVIVKGDRKSVYNQNAERVLQSIIL